MKTSLFLICHWFDFLRSSGDHLVNRSEPWNINSLLPNYTPEPNYPQFRATLHDSEVSGDRLVNRSEPWNINSLLPNYTPEPNYPQFRATLHDSEVSGDRLVNRSEPRNPWNINSPFPNYTSETYHFQFRDVLNAPKQLILYNVAWHWACTMRWIWTKAHLHSVI